MKNEITKKVLLFSIGIFVFVHLNAQKHDAMVQQLLQQNNWFVLDKEYPQIKDSIKAPELKWLTESMLNIRFNNTKAAISGIDTLLYKYQQVLGFQNAVKLLIYKTALLGDVGKYDLAADELKNFIDQVGQSLPQEELKGFVKSYNYYNLLRHEAPPTIVKPNKDIKVPFGVMDIDFVLKENDGINETTNTQLGIVKISIQGNEYIFILDTGFEKTCILDNLAKKLNLQYLEDSVSIIGNGFVKGKLAILDSISIGEVTLCNSLVVITDEILASFDGLANDEMSNSIHGVLGIDFIKRLGEIQLFPNNKTIIIPQNESELPHYGRNVILDDRDYIIIKAFDNEQLIKFHLDTGNSNSHMFKTYFSKNKDEIDNKLEKRTNYSFGIAEGQANIVYHLPSIEFFIGNTSCSIKDLSIYTDNIFIEEPNADGSLGYNFVKNFSKITLNLNKMFIQVEK